jgi:hypothetical protein
MDEREGSTIPFPVAVLALFGLFVVAGWLWAIPFGWKVTLIVVGVAGFSWLESRRR